MSWLNGVIGQGIAGSLGNMAQQNASQAGQYGLAGQQAYNQNSAQQSAMAQQAAMIGQHQMSAGTMNHTPPQWMFKGKFMSFVDFVNSVFPDDTAEKTAFILKHSEQ